MKKILISCCIFSFLISCDQNSSKVTTDGKSESSPANPPTTSQIDIDGPVIKFEKATHDFGTVTDGDTVRYNFKFTNVGKKDLLIANAFASCGCTVPSFPKEAIKPGDSGEIKVVFNSANRVGPVDKTVTVVANTIPDQTQVKILGKVEAKK